MSVYIKTYLFVKAGLELGSQEGSRKLPQRILKIRGHSGNLQGHRGKNYG